MQINLQQNGQSVGPFSIEQVQAGLASGIYQLTDLAWYPGAAGWVSLGSVPGIGSPEVVVPPQTSSLAIWSLVLGILSFFCIGLPGIGGVICGHLALSRIRKSGGKQSGAGMATAGLITGYLGMVIGLISGVALIAGLTAPMVIRQRKKADQAQAMSNARSLGVVLFEFGSDQGSFPSAATAKTIADGKDSSELEGNSSNARFRQLLRADFVQSEMIFYAHADGVRKPDNNFTQGHALENKECGFAYVENLDPKDETRRPIAMTPFVPGTYRFDSNPFDGKAVILWTDNTVTSIPIERGTGKAMLNGKDILDPSQPMWGGKAPVVLLPE